MTRNFKALGMALCVAFALSAVATSAASAQDLFTVPNNPTFLTGIQTGTPSGNVFGTKGSSVTTTCTGATYTGMTGLVFGEVTVTPSFTGCTTFNVASPVDVNGCKFVLTGTTHNVTNTAGVADKEATVKLNCNHTGNIKITAAFGCAITFSDTSGASTVNQNLLGIRYTNGSNAGIWDTEVDVTVDKIHYTTTGGCAPFGLKATDNDGFLTEKVTLKGYSDSAHTKQIDVTVTGGP